MPGNQFLHIGPPMIRLMPVELLLDPKRDPLVYRPRLADVERENLIESLRTLVGQQYNTIRVYSFVARSVRPAVCAVDSARDLCLLADPMSLRAHAAGWV
jgi:hypothetical protein